MSRSTVVSFAILYFTSFEVDVFKLITFSLYLSIIIFIYPNAVLYTDIVFVFKLNMFIVVLAFNIYKKLSSLLILISLYSTSKFILSTDKSLNLITFNKFLNNKYIYVLSLLIIIFKIIKLNTIVLIVLLIKFVIYKVLSLEYNKTFSFLLILKSDIIILDIL